jgi:Tol biopolymer transport system component
MHLSPGTRLGPYEIVAPIGAGGMGEVYRARDTRLGRDVAIKVLPQHLSDQPEVRARFEREAKMVSSLNHPHVCVLYDVGREGDTDYLVMELIEGDSLAARLRKGPLPAAELLRTGTQIADALDRAHRAGVIHRDLKPGNVMLTRSGAKLMDFGLSRATGLTGGAPGASALTQSPTIAQALTAEGTLVGTFQYMSPEQLEGREADARSDIWALGCVLYEMATGRRAFEGRSQASLIASILEREPAPIGEVPSGSTMSTFGGPPHGLERLIRNCLAKDPEDRIQTAHDVKLQLQGIAESVGVSGTSVASAPIPGAITPARSPVAWLPWGIAAAGLLAAIGVYAWLQPRATARTPAFRFVVAGIPGATDTFWPRVSPDGRYLLIEARDSVQVQRAYVRRMDQVEMSPIPGTEGLFRAYWSPDSREVVFVSDDKIQRAPIAGGAPTVVCAASGGVDLSWGAKGQILMDGRTTDSLRVVPAGGGDLLPAARIDRASGEIGSAWPYFLPDGEHFLFIGVAGNVSRGGNIRLGRIGTLDSKVLGHSDGRVEYAPGGWVVFLRGSTLLAQKLDLGAQKLTGQPITLAGDVRIGFAAGDFSASPSGVLAIGRQATRASYSLREAGRSGVPTGRVLATGPIANPRLSPDGARVLILRVGGGNSPGGEVHAIDLARSTETQLTFSGQRARTPVMSPDGRRFAYALITPANEARLMIGFADGQGAPDSIAIDERTGISLTDWSESGSRLVYYTDAFQARAVSSDGSERVGRPLGNIPGFSAQHRISPDGRWLAYGSGTSPADVQVFVTSLEGPPGRWQISNASAFNPHWTHGGNELVYEGRDGQIMAVAIDTRGGFRAGTPQPLFTLPAPSFDVDLRSWDVSPDGNRFFLLSPISRAQILPSIEVVTDFQSLVSRR